MNATDILAVIVLAVPFFGLVAGAYAFTYKVAKALPCQKHSEQIARNQERLARRENEMIRLLKKIAGEPSQ